MSNSESLESSPVHDIGIDFGTSKCAMYWASRGAALELLPVMLESNSEILRSAVYIQAKEEGGRTFQIGEQALETFLSSSLSESVASGRHEPVIQ